MSVTGWLVERYDAQLYRCDKHERLHIATDFPE